MNVTVFGGAQPQPGSTAYLQAYELGKGLAEAGHIILTGGYIGTMEAVSKGAVEAGGHVIGVTCQEIEAWRNIQPNRWVAEERRFNTLQERLNELVKSCDAAIALPGGPGTLTEIALTWNLLIVDAIPAKPLILVGNGWRSVFEKFFEEFNTYMPANQHEYIQFVPDVHSAIHALSRS